MAVTVTRVVADLSVVFLGTPDPGICSIPGDLGRAWRRCKSPIAGNGETRCGRNRNAEATVGLGDKIAPVVRQPGRRGSVGKKPTRGMWDCRPLKSESASVSKNVGMIG